MDAAEDKHVVLGVIFLEDIRTEELVAYLKDLESRYPGLEYVNLSNSMGTPQAVMLEQLRWFAKEVMPKFGTATR